MNNTEVTEEKILTPYRGIPLCRVCNITLDESNWSVSKRKQNSRICNKCNNDAFTAWRRANIIRSTNKDGSILNIRCKKRRYTNVCEMCGKECNTAYHHWDDTQPELGLYVCGLCHKVIHAIQELPSFEAIWLEKKRQVEAGEI